MSVKYEYKYEYILDLLFKILMGHVYIWNKFSVRTENSKKKKANKRQKKPKYYYYNIINNIREHKKADYTHSKYP